MDELLIYNHSMFFRSRDKYVVKIGLELNITNLERYTEGEIDLSHDVVSEPEWREEVENVEYSPRWHITYSNIIYCLPGIEDLDVFYHARPNVYSNQVAGIDFLDAKDFRIGPKDGGISNFETRVEVMEWKTHSGFIYVYANRKIIAGAPLKKIVELQTNGKLSSESQTNLSFGKTDKKMNLGGKQVKIPTGEDNTIKMWHRAAVSWSLGYKNHVCNIYAECDRDPVLYNE